MSHKQNMSRLMHECKFTKPANCDFMSLFVFFKAFAGNSNADSVVQHKLQHQVIARYVRLIPLNWNPNGRIGLRLETYGCPYSQFLFFSTCFSTLTDIN